MNKNELIKNISKETKLSQKDAKLTLEVISKVIKESLMRGDEVKLTGFGKFEVKDRAQRVTINPQTKQKMIIPKQKVASFKAGTELKKAISG